MSKKNITVYVDPWDKKLLGNKLFINNKTNDVRKPFVFLYEFCKKKNIELLTADKLSKDSGNICLYYSFGQIARFKELKNRKNVVLCSFYVFEPPIKVLHKKLDINYHLFDLNDNFKRIYTTSPINAINKCYGLNYNFDTSLFSYPQTHDNILWDLWEKNNRKLLVMINSYRYSRLKHDEFYSERIKALNYFLPNHTIDLYGNDWDRLSKSYLRNILISLLWSIKWFSLRRLKDQINTFKIRKYLNDIGSSNNKYLTLSSYKFAICYESMGIEGFITEKIFDCFFSGTIPIYLGAPDISKRIPADTFIDKRNFKNYKELYTFIISMSSQEYENYRNNIKEFLVSELYKPFSMKAFAERFVKDVEEDFLNINNKK